jgi:3-hydroxybutyryl-CoA dehydrogenase
MAAPIIESIEDFGLSKKKKSTKLFSRVGIVGCGNDGQYISRVCSSYGIEVIFIESSEEKILSSISAIGAIMDSRIKNWGATESEKKAVMSRIHGSTKLEDLKGCDLVIEAMRTNYKSRSLDARREVFEAVEKVVGENCIIATNSTLVIVSELSENLEHKERCISIHFMINSNESRIVEITKGLYTSDEVYDKVSQFVRMINRTVIPVEESVGLISVRMFAVILNEACEMVLEGVGSIDDIEKLMMVGYGMRFGPFTIADKMGLDRVARWMDNLFNDFGAPRYKPNPLIKRYLRQQHYGISSGKGFFTYDENGNRIK